MIVRNQERNLRAGTEAEITKKRCFSLLPMASSVVFLIQPRTPCSGRVLPTMDWDFPHQSMVKRPPKAFTQANLMEAVPQLRFSLPRWLSNVSNWQKLTRTLNKWVNKQATIYLRLESLWVVSLLPRASPPSTLHFGFPIQVLHAQSFSEAVSLCVKILTFSYFFSTLLDVHL